MPSGGLNIRWPDQSMGQEERLMRHKLYAALAFARANRLDKLVIDSPKRRFGIVTTGKSYLDVRQALDDLGIDEVHAAEIGLSLYKVAMSWPLEREGMRRFAEGLEEILVVEEKRALIENQLKEQLYNWRADVRPRVVGKFDEHYEALLPSYDELTPARVARVIARRIERFYTSARIRDRLAFLAAKENMLQAKRAGFQAHALLLLGLPAQHLDRGARREPRHRGHRLPFHGGVDGPQHGDLSPIWAARASPGSASRPSPRRSTSSPTWATAPTSTRAISPSARRSRPRSTSPTRSSTTTRSP